MRADLMLNPAQTRSLRVPGRRFEEPQMRLYRDSSRNLKMELSVPPGRTEIDVPEPLVGQLLKLGWRPATSMAPEPEISTEATGEATEATPAAKPRRGRKAAD